jgi:SAM-dependent methyltransferase
MSESDESQSAESTGGFAGGSRWNVRADAVSGERYDDRWRALAAAGQSIHGEADFVCGFEPASVLDAGCGTGRVAIELAARGIDVVGVDLDAGMLAEARRKSPELTWVHGDLLDVSLDRQFDVVVMAGNVMIFVAPGTEAAVVANVARHVRPGGVLVAGFQTDRGYTADAYDADCRAVGLTAVARYATWQADPIDSGDAHTYAVNVHRHP